MYNNTLNILIVTLFTHKTVNLDKRLVIGDRFRLETPIITPNRRIFTLRKTPITAKEVNHNRVCVGSR